MSRTFLNVGVLARLSVGSGAAALMTFLHAWLLLSWSEVADYGWFAFMLVVAGVMAAAQQAFVLTPLLLCQSSLHNTSHSTLHTQSMSTGASDDHTHLTIYWQWIAMVFLLCSGALVVGATYLIQSQSLAMVLMEHGRHIDLDRTLLNSLWYPQQLWLFAAINGLFVMSFMLRQYWRAFAVQQLQSDTATRSDWHFSLIALLVTVLLVTLEFTLELRAGSPMESSAGLLPSIVNVQTLLLGLIVANLCGCMVFKAQIQSSCRGQGTTFSLVIRNAVFINLQQDLKRWAFPALLGVIAVEASVNLHHYLLTLWQGPAMYAPFAFVLLLFRPLALLQQNMVQHERAWLFASFHGSNEPHHPRLNERLGKHPVNVINGHPETIQQWLVRLQRQTFRAWLANVGLLGVVFAMLDFWQTEFLPTLWGPLAQQGTALWCLITGCVLLCLGRALRAPYTALLQAKGDIVWLSRCSSLQALCAVPLFAVVMWALPYIWILLPMLALEIGLLWQLRQRCQGHYNGVWQ